MFQNKAVLQNVSWKLLLVLSAAIVVANLYILVTLFNIFNTFQLTALVVLIMGLVSSVGGYLLTKRANYEVYSTTRQVFGGLLNGVLLFGMIVIFMLILESTSVYVSLYIFAILGVIEFLSIRIFQGKRLTAYNVLGCVFLITSVYSVGRMFPVNIESLIYIFVALAVLKELSGRTMHTYLLSPWVNNIWNGVAIFAVTLISLPFIANIAPYKEVDAILSLPLWVGIFVVLLAVSVLCVQFFKRKIMIAKGYMQYKLQAWTVLLFAIALLSIPQLTLQFIVAFIIVIVTYSVIEGRVFVKE